MGCPTSVGNKKYVWDKGGLVRIYDDVDENESVSSEDIRFTYNAYGQRISKTYSYDPGENYDGDFLVSSTTTYTYDNSGRLIREYCTESYYESDDQTREFIYLYDESGMIGVMYSLNGASATTYYYRRNLQGDVTAIYTASGARVGEYAYDAFGNCTILYSSSNDLVRNNSIRYRGYYLDRETGLYYLNARYYNPQWRRFISPDDTAYLDPETPNGLNLYAYCNNDPVNYADPSGNLPEWAMWIIGGIVIAGLTIATIATGGAAGGVAGFIFSGALKGAIIGAVSGAVFNGIWEGASLTISGGSFWEGFYNGAAQGFMFGAIMGGISGAITSSVQVYNASKLWANTGSKTSYKQMVEHYTKHVINEGQESVAKNIVNYSKQAYRFFIDNSSLGYQIRDGVIKIAGAPGGIFNANGLIRSFWYILR